jgi:hypothetical protein
MSEFQKKYGEIIAGARATMQLFPSMDPAYVSVCQDARDITTNIGRYELKVASIRTRHPQAVLPRFVEMERTSATLLQRVLDLSPLERRAYFRVIQAPGTKLYLGLNERELPCWTILEEKQLIRSIGSYKWVPCDGCDLIAELAGGPLEADHG